MRLIASALALTLALLSLAKPSNASTILPISCSTVPALCGYGPPKAVGSLSVSASPSRGGGSTYTTPTGGLSTDRHAVSATQNPGGFAGSASAGFTVDYSGIHAILSAQGDDETRYNASTNGPIYVGGVTGEATVNAEILDYFYTSSPVPTGTFLSLTYTVDATATSIKGGESTLIGNFYSNERAFNTACTNIPYSSPYAVNFSGSYTTSCTQLLGLAQSQVVSADLNMQFTALALDGSTILDASNTAKITSVLVVDSNGNPLPNIQLYDASGYDYNAIGTPVSPSAVPEPSALLLLATGSLGLASQIRRRWSVS